MTIGRVALAAVAGLFLVGDGSASAGGYMHRGGSHMHFMGGGGNYGGHAVHYGRRFYGQPFYRHQHRGSFYGGYSTGIDVGFTVAPEIGYAPEYAPVYYQPPVQYAAPQAPIQYVVPQPQVMYAPAPPSYVVVRRTHRCGCEW